MRPFKVLLVDDDVRFLNGMRESLSECFTVTAVESGQEALARAKDISWDVIILDIDMPVMNGFELYPRLKETQTDATYIFLTCLTDDGTCIKTMNLGTDDFLNKPISAERLKATILHRIDKRREASGILRYQRLEMNLWEGAIMIDSKRVELTKKESHILQTLMRSQSKKVHRERMLQEIWGHTAVDAHTLDAHLSNLRKKILPAGVSIQTDGDHQLVLTEV